jgi:hypothetical protein
MGVLAGGRQRKDLCCVVQITRNHEIAVSGPYRRRNGALVFRAADPVVTEEERLRLPRDERLEPSNVHEPLAAIKERRT